VKEHSKGARLELGQQLGEVEGRQAALVAESLNVEEERTGFLQPRGRHR